jgi:hypothetical protein
VADEHPAKAEPVPARAMLGRTNHPRAIGAADQLADCGHETNHPPRPTADLTKSASINEHDAGLGPQPAPVLGSGAGAGCRCNANSGLGW